MAGAVSRDHSRQSNLFDDAPKTVRAAVSKVQVEAVSIIQVICFTSKYFPARHCSLDFCNAAIYVAL